MQLTEHQVKQGELFVEKNERILSFGIEKDTVFFWGAKSDKKIEGKPDKYVVLNKTDEVADNLHHVATLVEGTEPKHIFIEQVPPDPKKKYAKIVTDEGSEIVEDKS